MPTAGSYVARGTLSRRKEVMGQRYDACTPRPNGDKTWWHKVGSAWKNDKGMITVYLDSYPMIDTEKGKAVIMLFEPKAKEDSSPTKPRASVEDDEIPF